MDCAAKFEKDVAALPGVTRAELNFGSAKITVEGNFIGPDVSRVGSYHDITARLEDSGLEEKPSSWQRYGRVTITLISALSLAAGWLFTLSGSGAAGNSLFLIAIIVGGYTIGRKAFFSLQKLNFDMNVLMTAAVLGAVLIGEWSEGAAVAFLYSVSNLLESYTMEKARRSIRDLMDMAPREALVRRNGQELMLPVDEIIPQDLVIVKPGEKIPVDGLIERGSSTVNQASITGESVPVAKDPGDEVFAGTINQEGAIEIEVTKLVSDTTLAKIVHMVEEAQTQKAPFQNFVDRFAAVYTPVVILLAAMIVLIPPLVFGQQWHPWIYRGLALLVVSCPCALVVSTPVALITAIGNAARHGILIKGGLHLEQAGSLMAVAFDKTGTLTTGHPSVTEIITTQDISANDLLILAASIEQLSEHPLAGAIVAEAKGKNMALAQATNFTAVPGKGATAKIGETTYLIGSPRLFAEAGISTAAVEETIEGLQKQAKTAILVGTADGQILGAIALADVLRETARQAVAELKSSGIKRTIMLTGDNRQAAEVIAATAGVDEFRAELLPENKVSAVRELLAKYGQVAMVGDGINDAPALAASTVGIAMGGAGTDTALETADIALMSDNIEKLPYLIRLSRACLNVIRQNIYFSVAIKLVAVLLVFPGWLTLWMAILADMGASVLVTLNGIRLLGLNPEKR